MPYYPINLDLRGKRCLVVGAGDVAERKVSSLFACGAEVFVVSPDISPRLRGLAIEGKIEVATRPFAPSDLDGVFLVIAATDDRAVNSEVSRLGQELGLLVNVVDDPELCNFIVPASVSRGDLQISVSTGGASPALAKRIRQELEAQYGPEYEVFVEILGAAREMVKLKYADQKEREAVFRRMLDSGVLELLAAGQLDEAKKKAQECI
jgi:precorrin-2 dehydrogenase / sirohydrochlorin ferrochelatase